MALAPGSNPGTPNPYAAHYIRHKLTINCQLMLTAYDCNCGQHSLMQLNGLPCWQKLPAWALSVQNQINMSSLLSLFSTWCAKRRKAISCTGYRETFCHHSFTEANTPRLTCLSSGFRHGLDVLGVQMLSRDQ